MKLLEELKERLVGSIDITRDISDGELNELITSLISAEVSERNMTVRERMQLQNELFNAVRGLDVLQEILEDAEVTEIMVNGPDDIFIEKKGKLSRYPGRFSSREKLEDIIQNIVGKANKRVNESTPVADTRLMGGERVNVVLRPIAINGPVVTIRKFPPSAITMKELISLGSITFEAAEFLKGLVGAGYNLFICGGTGSGKTTFLNALSEFIPEHERVITIEDSAELQLEGIENLVSLECRPANTEGENGITIRDLIRTSLRMRPDRIIVGEVRGAEASDMLAAMNTGHDGSLSTGHANSPEGMLTRLETMVLMGSDIPLSAVKRQIASALDIIVHLARMRDGSRKVREITEVTGMENEQILLNRLFVLEELQGGEPQAGKWELKRTGNRLKNKEKLKNAGLVYETEPEEHI